MRESGNAKFCELLEFIVLRVPPVLLVPDVRSTLHSHLPLLITHYSSPITNRRAQPFIRRGTLHGVWMSRVILQGTAAMLILNFAPIIIGGKMI